jgi:hypothetical protein
MLFEKNRSLIKYKPSAFPHQLIIISFVRYISLISGVRLRLMIIWPRKGGATGRYQRYLGRRLPGNWEKIIFLMDGQRIGLDLTRVFPSCFLSIDRMDFLLPFY